MRKITLVAVIIVAMGMMIVAQSALAVKPAPVTGIANGEVTAFGINDPDVFPGVPSAPPPPGNASGPWKVVVHLQKTPNIVNFSATCQVAGVDYKLSYKGQGTLTVLSPTKVKINVPSMTVKSAGTSKTYARGTTIVIDQAENLVTVDINTSEKINIFGNVNLFKPAP